MKIKASHSTGRNLSRFPFRCAALFVRMVMFLGFAFDMSSLSADVFDNFTYSDSGSYITITGCSKDVAGLVEIPSSINGKPVAVIADLAFADCANLTMVTVPSGVTTVGNSAFRTCGSLLRAEFLGGAPDMGSTVFDYAATGFTVIFHGASSGFTTPTWNGYPAVDIEVTPVVTPVDLPLGYVGVAYNQALRATGGTTPYTWTLVDGALPPGLELGADGVIRGTPSVIANPYFRVRVTGGGGSSYSESSFAFSIIPVATAQFHGTVSKGGSPVPGLPIGAWGQTDAYLVPATTDSSGNFSLPVSAGVWTIVLWASHLNPNGNNLVLPSITKTIASGEDFGVALDILDGTGTISGSVVDGSGAALPNAIVSADTIVDGISYTAGAFTDDVGHYSFPVIDGDWNVNVTTEGLTFLSKTIAVSGSAIGDFAPSVAHITGIVTRDGVPFPDVHVSATTWGGGSSVEAVTDAVGHYDLGVSQGYWQINFVEAPNYPGQVLVQQPAMVGVSDGETLSGVNIQTFSSTGTISGTVKDGAGAFVPDAWVYGYARVNNIWIHLQTFTNASGVYSMPAVDGEWVVYTGLPGYEHRNITVSGSAQVDFAPFTVTVHLLGKVTKDGVGVSGAKVWANRSGNDVYTWAESVTDINGNFDLGVHAGTWNMGFSSAVFEFESEWVYSEMPTITVADGETVSNLLLNGTAATGTIHGTVRDAGGQPVADGMLIQATCTVGGVRYAALRSSSNGNYSIPVIDGFWTVDVMESYQNLYDPQTVNITGSAMVDFTARQLVPPLVVTVSPLADGSVGAAYSQTLTASGGAQPYTWSLVSGTLPPQLTLSEAGIVSGTPTSATTSDFTVQVTGSDGASSTADFSLSIASPYALWKEDRFTVDDTATGLTTLTSDFDCDGMANLLEYAFGRNPKAPDSSGVAPDFSGNKMKILFPCDSTRTDVAYTVQSSPTLADGSWTDIAQSLGGATTMSIGSLSSVSDTGSGLRMVTVTDSTVLPGGGRRFLRIQVSDRSIPLPTPTPTPTPPDW